MKVLFVRPNKDAFGFKPIGISLLSAICLQKGHEVRLFDTTFYDFGFEESSTTGVRINKYKPVDFSAYNIAKYKVDLRKEIHDALRQYSPDICAFSILADERIVAQELSIYIKEFKPDLPIIWGGIYPTLSAESVIGYEFVDYVCVGEGIEALPELLDTIENKKDVTSIKNVYAKKNGIIYKNETRPLCQDLDNLPFVEWGIYDKRQFYKPFDGQVVKGGDWMSNWGCPYKCTYCINNWLNRINKRIIRRYSAERAVRELKTLKEEYGLTFMRFHDEDFLMRPLEHLSEFAKLYSREVGLPFSIETNPHSVTSQKVDLLKAMGIASVSMPVESGNEYLRKTVLKRVDTIPEVIKAFGLFNQAGVRTVSFNMLGLPFENRERIFDTIEVNRQANPTVADSGFFFPFEGTELYDISIKNNFYDQKAVPVYRRDYPALDQPGLSRNELLGLHKCFSLYVKLPKSFYGQIERAEKDDPEAGEIFNRLSSIYYNSAVLNKGIFVNS